MGLRALYHALWHIEPNIRLRMRISTWFHRRVPVVGRFVAMWIDRTLLWAYGLDVTSYTVNIAALGMSHPDGVLLGGNGIVSRGRVVIMSGVKFVGRSPTDTDYLRRNAEQAVSHFGDNVVIGANSVVVGPIDICDNVVIGAMSLVNKSIDEPGTYAGVPARRIRDEIPGEEWVSHLRLPGA